MKVHCPYCEKDTGQVDGEECGKNYVNWGTKKKPVWCWR